MGVFNGAGVYMILCTKNNKKYIGSAKNINKRWQSHKRMLEDKTHHCIKLQKDYDKYGKEFFEYKILEKCSESNARKIELEYIEELKIKEYGYNSLNFKESIKLKHDYFLKKMYQYCIDNGYKSDGNIYMFNLFRVAKTLHIKVTNILDAFGINKKEMFSGGFYIPDTNDVVGVTVDTTVGDVVLYAWNDVVENKYYEILRMDY